MVDVDRVTANLRHMAAFEAKPNVRPLPDTAVTRGFEKVAFPKLVRELQDPNLVVRQKALLAARELLVVPVNHVQCIAAGATPAIVALLADPDSIVRERAAAALRLVVTKELGARDVIQHGGMAALVGSLEDPQPAVRDAAYGALVEAARFDPARRALENMQDALPRVLQLVLLESPGPRASEGLRLLNACAQVRYSEAVLTQLLDFGDAVPALTSLLQPDQPEGLQQLAAQLLATLASREDAKLQAVSVGAVERLLACLSPQRVALSTAASAALMAVTVCRDGKYAALAAPGGLAALLRVTEPTTNEQLCTNAMVCIANVAEAPEARAVLAAAGAEHKLTGIFEAATGELMRSGAAHAIRQCRFRSRPYEVLPTAKSLAQQH